MFKLILKTLRSTFRPTFQCGICREERWRVNEAKGRAVMVDCKLTAICEDCNDLINKLSPEDVRK